MGDDPRAVRRPRRHEAVEQAYQLIESAQGRNDAARVETADREAARHGWHDVRLLLHFARWLACAWEGRDDADRFTAMVEAAGMHLIVARIEGGANGQRP